MRWPLTSSPDGVSRWLPAPPWLVVEGGWPVWDLPRVVDSWRAMWAVTTGAVDPAVAGQPWAWTIQLVQGTRLAVEVALVGSLAVLLVPALRGRWVEHRWRLGPSSPGAGAVADQFVREHAAHVREDEVQHRVLDDAAVSDLEHWPGIGCGWVGVEHYPGFVAQKGHC